jgi:hypothetical protein
MFEKRKGGKISILVQILSILMVFAIIAGVIFLMPSFRKSGGRIRSESIENSIKKYAVQCYAAEGSYPPDLEYLEEHYGLILDKENYFYYYDAFSSNFMPKISVYSRMKVRR